MGIDIYWPQCKDQEVAVESFIEGLIKHGHDCNILFDEQTPKNKIAVVFQWDRYQYGLGKRIRMIGGRALVLNYGYVKRDHYWAAGWDNQNGRADFINSESTAGRWKSLGIALKPWRKGGEYIVLAGQVPRDTSISHVSIFQWCENIVAEIKHLSNRPIVFRPHPLARDITPDIKGTERSERELSEDLKNAWAVVTYNSTTGSMAVIDGIPVFAGDAGSIAWPVANRRIIDIENPRMPDREQWAYNLAWAQWTLKEFANGEAWEHLKSGTPT